MRHLLRAFFVSVATIATFTALWLMGECMNMASVVVVALLYYIIYRLEER